MYNSRERNARSQLAKKPNNLLLNEAENRKLLAAISPATFKHMLGEESPSLFPTTKERKQMSENQETFVKVKGVTTEIPKGVDIINVRTLMILSTLEQYGIVYFGLDESSSDQETLTHIKSIAAHAKLHMVKPKDGKYYLIDNSKVAER